MMSDLFSTEKHRFTIFKNVEAAEVGKDSFPSRKHLKHPITFPKKRKIKLILL